MPRRTSLEDQAGVAVANSRLERLLLSHRPGDHLKKAGLSATEPGHSGFHFGVIPDTPGRLVAVPLRTAAKRLGAPYEE